MVGSENHLKTIK